MERGCNIIEDVTTDKKEDKISGKDWLRYSVSVWDDSKTIEEKRIGHPASFPVTMVNKLIRIYSKPNEVVLDPFNGIGSTMVSAASLNRKCIGFDTNEEFTNITKERLSKFIGDFQIINDTCVNMVNYIKEGSIDFCMTSPPYWDVLNRKRSSDKKPIANYSDYEEDLGNIASYEKFLESLKSVFNNVFRVLKENKHCAIVVMDLRKKSKFYPFHIDVTNQMKDIGFELEDFIIWDRRKDYNNLKPLGYPWVFRVNKVHEYICIFKKPG